MEQQTPLQALIAKYRDYPDFEELDLTDINQSRWGLTQKYEMNGTHAGRNRS